MSRFDDNAMNYVLKVLNSPTENVIFHCEKHGDVEAPILAGSNDKGFCWQCEKEQQAQHVAEILKQEKAEKIINSGIEPRFSGLSYRDFKQPTDNLKSVFRSVLDYGNAFPAHLKKGQGMVITGTTGTGKTMLGSLLTKHVIHNGYSARYVTLPDLINEIYASFDDSKKSEKEIIEKYADYDLLVIDEISATKGSQAEKTRLFNLINKRYNRLKSTVIMSNCSFDELSNYVDGRVTSRLQQDCRGRIIGIESFDWRGQS